MRTKSTPQIKLNHLEWSLARLKESIENEDTEYYRGAALNRFGLTCSVALETIRAFAKENKQTCFTDESCFQWVEKQNWLEKNMCWEDMLDLYKRIKSRTRIKEDDKNYMTLKTYYILLSHLSEHMKTI